MYHDLCGFIGDELADLDRKAASGEKLSMQEVQYADLLGHAKKNLLTAEAMEDGGYGDPPRARRPGWERRYRDDGGMAAGLRNLLDKAPDERSRRRLEAFIADMER